MEQIKSIMIADEELIPVESTGATRASRKPATNSRVGQPEGILGKIQSFFQNPERKTQKELRYHLGLIKKDPENISARLRVAEIYLKQGEKRKATSLYLQTAEIFSRKHLYPQAIAIYKRIQKQYPFLWQLYPKFAETCRKMELQQAGASVPDQETDEILLEGMELKVTAIGQNKIKESPAKKLQRFPKTAKALEENDKSGRVTDAGMAALPAERKEGAFFKLSAQQESIRPSESGAVEEVAMEKPCGFGEIFKELKKIDTPSNAYPDFHYNMGVACREMGLIDEAIEQFSIAREAGEKPFDAARLLGLCFLDKERPQEARLSFQEALKLDGIPKEKIIEVELAIKRIDQIKEEGTLDFLKGNKDERQRPKGSSQLEAMRHSFGACDR